ncbi:MAG: hypothetical protein R3A46_06820 [Thermomicrobiales bacterium]
MDEARSAHDDPAVIYRAALEAIGLGSGLEGYARIGAMPTSYSATGGAAGNQLLINTSACLGEPSR